MKHVQHMDSMWSVFSRMVRSVPSVITPSACMKILQARGATSQNSIQRPITPQFSGTVPSRPHAVLTNSTVSVSNANTADKIARPTQPPVPSTNTRRAEMLSNPGFEPDLIEENKGETNESLTPSSTPTHSRKNRRKSNLFKKNEDEKDRGKKLNGIGSGRAIPLKQGFLYKRSSKPLGKEWKTKKYVTLTDDARLTYHPSIHDYMDNTHGKEIDLSRTTVKIPGVAFRQVGGRITSNGLLRSQLSEPSSGVSNQAGKISSSTDMVPSANDSASSGLRDATSVKKRHRRIRSNPKSSVGDAEDSEGYEFQLISMDRQWHFEAKGPEERDDWVMFIERAIMTRLQLNESTKRTRAMNNSGSASSNTGLVSTSNLTGGVHSGGDNTSLTSGRSGAGDSSELATTEHLIESIRSVAGNQYCADCGACDPDWASLNLGAMVCISCSGIHRQLGTHISRVRSLHLDEWSSESAAVMCAIGNTLANSVWEAAVPVNAGNRKKPEPNSSREEKEIWIRAKYDRQEFLPPLPYPDAPLQQQLIDAIARQDTRQVVLCLALATPETVNAPYSRQDPRAAIHIAATLGNLVYLQLLLWYNGDPTVTDHEGRNAYYYAHCSQKYDCAEFLRRSGCPKQLVPPSPTGLTPAQMGRSMLPMPVPVPHGQAPPPGSYPQPTTLESHVPTHSAIVPCNVSQPYHFSHLQQHQPGLPPPHLPSQVIGIQQNHVLSGHQTGSGPTLAPSMSTPAQAYTHASPTQSTVIQSGGGTTVSGVLTTNPAGMGHRGPLIQQQQQQLLSSCVPYSNGVNQALGATLPRRHGPNPLGPQALQPFIRPLGQQQQQLASTVTRRPQPGLVVERNPVSGLSRVAVSNITPPAPTHNAQIAYTRPTPTSNVSGSGNLSGIKQQQSTQQQQFIAANQEVGL
ncbi:Arf-GAP GTPase ANK repeat and PH domain-containing protein 1/2/3 [Clonorchis sinensis]|uniref:Arf-GAP GTPase ANK repeat and PH domain-containing protein 1/2/3 n=1 Tax=Clonorchis sinensis TaxID=79923 RepID=G7YDH8_CLOSI|nr:Arf-GAP GTPase ANK repeat and PH domain-containing protein 1/2/3 [Clonorchis sinensis]